MANLKDTYKPKIDKLLENGLSEGKLRHEFYDGFKKIVILIRGKGGAYMGSISLIGYHLGQEILRQEDFIRFIPAPAV
jgi:hypothetical protein